LSLRAILMDCGDTVLVEKRYGDRIAVIDEPEAVAGAATVIPKLAARYPLAIVANTSIATEGHIRAALATVGLERYFRVVVTSVDVGFRKPDPGIFAVALARLALTSSDVVMVGNQLDTDIAGARALNIPSILLRWNEGYPDHLDGVEPTRTIRRLEDLPQALRAIEGG
jgi:putative hydrolase of the HAD superfamily